MYRALIPGDFEIRINREQRTMEQLKAFVRILWKIITDAEDYILEKYPSILLPEHPTLTWRLPKEITFVTAQELHDEFPNYDIYGRENKAVEKYDAIFICGMGWPMTDGSPAEEQRSPSYDDWNLNVSKASNWQSALQSAWHPLEPFHFISTLQLENLTNANSLSPKRETYWFVTLSQSTVMN
jgi:asparagine synthetase A